MATWAGQGGAVTVGASDTAIAVGRWKLSKKASLANKTNSTSGGIKQRQATIKDEMVTFEMPWDDTINPELSGFAAGAQVKVVLNLGQSGSKFTSAGVIIESTEYDNDEDEDIVRLSVTGYANFAFVYS